MRSQLISSSSIAYQQLMRIGFPTHMSIADIIDKSKSVFENYTSTNPKDFCNVLLRSCNLKWKDFKLGHTQVFFRSGKWELFSAKLKDDTEVIKQRIDKLKLLRKKLKVAIVFARFCVIGKSLNKKSVVVINETQPEEQVDIPRKKMKLEKQCKKVSSTAHTRIEGNEDESHIFIKHCLPLVFIYSLKFQANLLEFYLTAQQLQFSQIMTVWLKL